MLSSKGVMDIKRGEAMDRIEIHWMTLIVSIVLLVLLVGGLVVEKIKDRRFRKNGGREINDNTK